MASTIKEELGKSVGTEVLMPCTKCAGKTAHEVFASLDQSGTVTEYDIDWNHEYQIVKCKGCKTVSFRSASWSSENYIQIAEDEWELDISETLYPPRIDGIKDLGDRIIHLPQDLRRVYAETIKALVNDSPVLAGIGLRAMVETVCKEKDAKGKDLYHQINDLAANHVLTPSGASILHKVRTLGNKAAHEVKPHTLSQLSLAMSVVEHMLNDVYILPRLVENEF